MKTQPQSTIAHDNPIPPAAKDFPPPSRHASRSIGRRRLGESAVKPSERRNPRPPPASGSGGFLLCLNTATIRGQKLGIVKEIEVAANAGYQGIEPWVEAIEKYQKEGGSLPDLKRRIADLGLMVPSAIGFPQWIVDDDVKRAQGLERAKLEMDLVAQIGGRRVAAPPGRGN